MKDPDDDPNLLTPKQTARALRTLCYGIVDDITAGITGEDEFRDIHGNVSWHKVRKKAYGNIFKRVGKLTNTTLIRKKKRRKTQAQRKAMVGPIQRSLIRRYCKITGLPPKKTLDHFAKLSADDRVPAMEVMRQVVGVSTKSHPQMGTQYRKKKGSE